MRFIALVLLLACAGLPVTDQFCCPDGCRDASTGAADEHGSTGGDCALCAMAYSPAPPARFDVTAVVIAILPQPPRLIVGPGSAPSVFRPPRLS
jgi:hypothetical protein